MNDFDWIGLVVVLFFLLLPLLSTFFKKRPPIQKRAPSKPIHPSPLSKVKRQVIPPPPTPQIKKEIKPRSPPQKKFTSRYGSIKNGIILSEILKRPYLD